jgi:hypothetical protein
VSRLRSNHDGPPACRLLQTCGDAGDQAAASNRHDHDEWPSWVDHTRLLLRVELLRYL